jgi:hypothetical protein
MAARQSPLGDGLGAVIFFPNTLDFFKQWSIISLFNER